MTLTHTAGIIDKKIDKATWHLDYYWTPVEKTDNNSCLKWIISVTMFHKKAAISADWRGTTTETVLIAIQEIIRMAH